MTVQILTGDCRALLPALADESVHCVVTSPPYYGLRDYGDPSQIGLEPTLSAYLAELVGVFREVRRVLRRDGVVWLNIGDSYAGNSGSAGKRRVEDELRDTSFTNEPKRARSMAAVKHLGIKAKDLMLVPARLAIALQEDGWWVRQRVVWAKPNPKTESCEDRPTSAHEEVLMLTRRPTYFYDRFAILEPLADAKRAAHTPAAAASGLAEVLEGANRRNVWTIPTEPFRDQHFATFPGRLAELCILAATSARGCCPACGAPLRRVVEVVGPARAWQRQSGGDAEGGYAGRSRKGHAAAGVEDASALKTRILAGMKRRDTVGWRPSCQCKAAAKPVPCTVLDPFGGAGTTGLVADRLHRDAILIEVSPKHATTARRRIATNAPLFTPVAGDAAADRQDEMFPALQEAV